MSFSPPCRSAVRWSISYVQGSINRQLAQHQLVRHATIRRITSGTWQRGVAICAVVKVLNLKFKMVPETSLTFWQKTSDFLQQPHQ